MPLGQNSSPSQQGRFGFRVSGFLRGAVLILLDDRPGNGLETARFRAHNSISTMARLVVQPGSPAAWEIQLKAGINSLGRGPANDVTLDDPSVSGSHCQIVVDKGNAIIRDLGSTNGTFVNRTRVLEAALQPGQTIHLGGLEMMFHPDAPASTGVAQAVPIAPPLPPPRAAGPPRAVRVGPAATVALAAPPVAAGAGRQAPMAAPPVTAAPTTAVGSGPCKYHPRTPGRFFCSHCRTLLLRAMRHHPRASEVLPHLRHRMRAGAGADSAPGGAEGLLRPAARRVHLPVSRQRVAGAAGEHVCARLDGFPERHLVLHLPQDYCLWLLVLLHAEPHPRHGQRGGTDARFAGV